MLLFLIANCRATWEVEQGRESERRRNECRKKEVGIYKAVRPSAWGQYTEPLYSLRHTTNAIMDDSNSAYKSSSSGRPYSESNSFAACHHIVAARPSSLLDLHARMRCVK